jgi:hypothetical protein
MGLIWEIGNLENQFFNPSSINNKYYNQSNNWNEERIYIINIFKFNIKIQDFILIENYYFIIK